MDKIIKKIFCRRVEDSFLLTVQDENSHGKSYTQII